MKLNSQGEQLNKVNEKLDDLDIKIDNANKDATFLKQLEGGVFSFVGKAPKDTERSINLVFAESAPKDSQGRPIASPRVTSLTLGVPSRKHGRSRSPSRSDIRDIKIELDESATDEQRQRSRAAEKIIDDNLDVVHTGVSNLKKVAISLGEEINRQNEVVSRINDKVDTGAHKINKLNGKVRGIYI